MNNELRTMNYEQRLSAVALAKAETTNYFMQNKPNFPNAQMNITSVISMNYEQRTTNYFIPIKPNFKPNFKRYLAKAGNHELAQLHG